MLSLREYREPTHRLPDRLPWAFLIAPGLGAATYGGPVGDAQYVPSDAVITYLLRRFIADTREISSDFAVLKRNWLDAYALVTPRGGNMLSAFVQNPDHDPFRRMQEERVTVEFLSAVRVSGDTWQVDWRESDWDKGEPRAARPSSGARCCARPFKRPKPPRP
jgi:type IV secretory pathway TrbF-like protein